MDKAMIKKVLMIVAGRKVINASWILGKRNLGVGVS